MNQRLTDNLNSEINKRKKAIRYMVLIIGLMFLSFLVDNTTAKGIIVGLQFCLLVCQLFTITRKG